MSINAAAFRATLGRFATGVTIITTRWNDQLFGMTVNSFTSVSLDPPLVLFCAQPAGHTAQAIEKSGLYAVNILSQEQQSIALRFAGMTAYKEEDRFRGLDFEPSPDSGCPWLAGSLAWLDCKLLQVVPGGDHHVLLAQVTNLRLGPMEAPLLFFAGSWPTVQPALSE